MGYFSIIEKPVLFLVFLSTMLAAYVSLIQLSYHENFITFAWDLGIFLQALDTFIHSGKLFYNTVELPFNPSGSYFGIHFSPILFLFAIPYAVFPYPFTLFFIKNLLILSTSAILYMIGRKSGLSKLSSTMVAISYIFFIPLYGPLTFDFHPYTPLPFFISLIHYFVLQGNIKKTFPVLLLGLATIEFASIIFLFYGISLLLRDRRSFAKLIILTSVTWLFISMIIIMSLNHTQLNYYLSMVFNTNTTRQPGGQLVYKASYFFLCYGLILFLPIMSPYYGFLSILPWILFASLSYHLPYCSPYYQYASFITSLLFIAIIDSLSRIKKRTTLLTVIPVTLAIVNSTLAIILGPIGLGLMDYVSSYDRPASYETIIRYDIYNSDTPNKYAIYNALNLVTSNYSILVPNHIFPHIVRDNSYVSFLPKVTGWPIIYEDLQLQELTEIHLFSLHSKQPFLGEIGDTRLIINEQTFDLRMIENNSTIYLRKPVKLERFLFESHIKPVLVNVSQVILATNGFQLGLATNGYIVFILYPQEREPIIEFSEEKLQQNNWYSISLRIDQNEVKISLNGKEIMKIKNRNLVVAWLVDNVDYVLLDSSASLQNFRIGTLPIILDKKYRLVAAGDGVMVFKKTNGSYPADLINLTKPNYLAYIYASDEPLGEPTMVMPLSKLYWKPIYGPISPYCINVTLSKRLENVRLTGAEEYAFAYPSELAYSASNITIHCSAIIRGKIYISESGYYKIKITHEIPSTIEIYIDNAKVCDRENIYLEFGKHELEILWRKIRKPIFNIEIKKLKD
jgi:uncharacterized membrane protein